MPAKWQAIWNKYYIEALERAKINLDAWGGCAWRVDVVEEFGMEFPIPYVMDLSKCQIFCEYSTKKPSHRKYFYQHKEDWISQIPNARYAFDPNVLFFVYKHPQLIEDSNLMDCVRGVVPISDLKHPFKAKWAHLLPDKLRLDRMKEIQSLIEKEKTRHALVLEDKLSYEQDKMEQIVEFHTEGKAGPLPYTQNVNWRKAKEVNGGNAFRLPQSINNPNSTINSTANEAMGTVSTRSRKRKFTPDETKSTFNEMVMNSSFYQKVSIRHSLII